MDTGHCVRPKGLPEAFGYYWPGGAPSECPPLHELNVSTYRDEHGQPFTIAQTHESIQREVAKWGFWSPFMPLFVTPSILRSSNG